MSNWLEQFASKKESLSDHWRPPAWFHPFTLIDAVPGATPIADDLWSTSDGFFVHARTSILQRDGTERRFDRPVAIIAFYAKSLDSVQWHRHVLQKKPELVPLTDPTPIFPRFAYGEWTERFRFSESASYRLGDGSGAYVDKAVVIGTLTVCFLSRRDDAAESPYLFEVCHDPKTTA